MSSCGGGAAGGSHARVGCRMARQRQHPRCSPHAVDGVRAKLGLDLRRAAPARALGNCRQGRPQHQAHVPARDGAHPGRCPAPHPGQQGVGLRPSGGSGAHSAGADGGVQPRTPGAGGERVWDHRAAPEASRGQATAIPAGAGGLYEQCANGPGEQQRGTAEAGAERPPGQRVLGRIRGDAGRLREPGVPGGAGPGQRPGGRGIREGPGRPRGAGGRARVPVVGPGLPRLDAPLQQCAGPGHGPAADGQPDHAPVGFPIPRPHEAPLALRPVRGGAGDPAHQAHGAASGPGAGLVAGAGVRADGHVRRGRTARAPSVPVAGALGGEQRPNRQQILREQPLPDRRHGAAGQRGEVCAVHPGCRAVRGRRGG